MDQPIPRRFTMRELAAAMNISIGTVSLALRNDPRIAQKTRRRVQAFALKNGYRVDPSVAAVMSQISRPGAGAFRETLGWINAREHPDFFTDKKLQIPGVKYSQNLYDGALERARQLGYGLDICWLKAPRMTGRRMSAILAARGIRGLLLPPLSKAYGHLSMDWSGFAVTVLSYTMSRPQFHRVFPHVYDNTQMILRVLRHRGYKRAGLLIHPHLRDSIQSAFYFYQQGITVQNRVPVLVSVPPFEEACAAWLKKYRPDVVITVGEYRHVREIEIGDPAYSRRLGVAVMDSGAGYTDFSGVDQGELRIGAAAVDHLSGQLSRNERGIPEYPDTVLIKGTWVEGRTLTKKRVR